jgi:hypothetical protein
MYKPSLVAPLYLFLLACTILMAVFNPSFAIFPVFVTFVVSAALFFRASGGDRWREELPPRLDSASTVLPPESSAPAIKYERTDEDIAAELNARFRSDPTLRGSPVTARSRSGHVIVVGHVHDEAAREHVQELANEVQGAVNVRVHLNVA